MPLADVVLASTLPHHRRRVWSPTQTCSQPPSVGATRSCTTETNVNVTITLVHTLRSGSCCRQDLGEIRVDREVHGIICVLRYGPVQHGGRTRQNIFDIHRPSGSTIGPGVNLTLYTSRRARSPAAFYSALVQDTSAVIVTAQDRHCAQPQERILRDE